MGYFAFRFLSFVLLFCGLAHADVLLPLDTFFCPPGTRLIKSGVPVSFAGCFKSNGTESDQDLQLRSWETQVKAMYPYGSQTIITANAEFDQYWGPQFSEALAKFSDTVKPMLPEMEDAKDYVYTVKSQGLVLNSPVRMRTSEPYDWEMLMTEDPSTTVLHATTICRKDNDFVHVEYPEGLVIEKFESGGLKIIDSQCNSHNLERPFTSTYTCEDRLSGNKLEFVIELPTSVEKLAKKAKDPVYLTFKKNGSVVFKKKIAKNFKSQRGVMGEDLYSIVSNLHPKHLRTPLDWDLDAALDCFDHLEWKAMGVLKPKPDSRDLFDAEGIQQDVRAVGR